MPVHCATFRILSRSSAAARGIARHSALLVTVSAVALLATSPVAHARSVNGAAAQSAPNIAADAAAAAAQAAAGIANQTQNSLARAARAIQDIQTMQAAARAAALARQTSTTSPVAVPNGLGAGGLQMAPGAVPGPGSALWRGANAPTQSVDGSGQTQVNIQQTLAQAILNWTSFNVGARTTLTFDQQGNATWVALNRVVGSVAPSQILGNIKADGQVYVINQNGIIFGGGSQVNVGSLIASTAGLTDTQFLTNGIYSTQSGSTYTPSFTAAGGKVVVENGALISTAAPTSVTAGGGFVLLMGTSVENAGSISTPKGQAMLAAGDDFILRPGFGTLANTSSTTRGNEISPQIAIGSTSGDVSNDGLIFSQQGDITLAGRTLTQSGVLIATTSVNTRGTIHLVNSATDSLGTVTLNGGSLTTVIPELLSGDTALDSQRDAMIAASVVANNGRGSDGIVQFNNLSLVADRLDQSRIEIVTGGTVTFKNGSMTSAQGGQIAVSASTRIFAEGGATLDVSGVRDVSMAMASNNISVNVQGNELRDSPANRDSGALFNSDVWIDVRDLTLLPAGTGGYASDRYYTAGGLLEVGGYLSTTPHTIGEWSAVGGSITLVAPQVIAQQGATFDISGGSLDYAAGWIRSTNLLGADGRIYSVDNAPADMSFLGFAGGFSRKHNIQGQPRPELTEIWTSMLDRGRTSVRWENAYTVGRDAGRLVLSAPTSVFEANILADTVAGQRQIAKRPDGVTDGYKLTQTTVAQNGALVLGKFNASGLIDGSDSHVVFGDFAPITAGLGANTVLPADRTNTSWFDSGLISRAQLGGIDIASKDSIDIDSALSLAPGANVRLIAPIVDIAANLTVPSGNVTITNLVAFAGHTTRSILLSPDGTAQFTLESGATIDMSGLWVNAWLDTDNLAGLGSVNGGNVTFDSSQGIKLAAGSTIDVSSGGAILATGKTQGGKGGNVSLTINDVGQGGTLVLGSQLLGYGVSGGGTLTINAASVLIGDNVVATAPGQLVLPSSFFSKGFSNYDITGVSGVTVAGNADVEVIAPVYQFTAASYGAATGSDPSAVLQVVVPPLYVQDQRAATLTQRAGASLALRATAAVGTGTGVLVDTGATIRVDPLQSVRIEAANQITVNGTIVAPGGLISLVNDTTSSLSTNPVSLIPGQSIWLGDTSKLDVSGRAVIAYDMSGQPYGIAPNGGSIIVGTDQTGTGLASNAFIVIRPGAVLDASGADATIALAANASGDLSKSSRLVNLAGNGGSIALASNNGLYIDGTLQAFAGGANAAGGSLSLTLGTTTPQQIGGVDVPDTQRVARTITISQGYVASGLSNTARPGQVDPSLVAGNARTSADRIEAGGFDNVSLYARDIIMFEGPVSLHAGQSISLIRGIVASSDASSAVTLSAPYVLLDGNNLNDTLAYINTSNPRPQPSTQASTATFTVNADLIDVKDDVAFGVHSSIKMHNGSLKLVDAAGFGDINLVSQGDIRFGTSTFSTKADVTLTAEQLYPLSGVIASLTTTGTLNILRAGDDTPQVPYSVLGSLSLSGGTINQGGVVRAPLGLVSLNAIDTVNLLPGSITSASANGLIVPYGGTTDGVSYLYNGVALVFPNSGAPFTPGVKLGGKSVNAQPGALLDLSGGGDLAGSGFISGRGGSVDVLTTALANANPSNSFSAAGNAVYAIVPGYASGYAPVDAAAGKAPGIGQQVTVGAGVPGLPAGTYTLLPARYALLPGAFRVEIGKTSTAQIGTGPVGNGTYVTSGFQGVVNTGQNNTLASELIITPGAAVRAYSQYNETTYSGFALAQAKTLSQLQPALPADAKTLQFQFSAGSGQALTFDGTVLFAPAPGGQGGTATIEASGAAIEVFGTAPTPGFAGVSLRASEIDSINATRMIIGGHIGDNLGISSLVSLTSATSSVTVRDGAILTGPEIFLMAMTGGVTLEAGAGIVTLGHGDVPFDSRDGYIYTGNAFTVVAVSNGWLNFLPPNAAGRSGPINVGACGVGGCSSDTILSSDGTIGFVTAGSTQFGTNILYGTRNLSFAVSSVNIGSADALASANVPNGLQFNQDFLGQLLAGNALAGAPKLEQLTLAAKQSINFFGTVNLNTIDPVTGQSVLKLNLNTPAIYGYGNAGDVVTLTTGTLIWNGIQTAGAPISSLPGNVTLNGPGSGTGTFNIVADNIVFGYAPTDQAVNTTVLDRLMVGFSTVNLIASQQITANNKGSLSVYQSQGDYVEGSGFIYSGGNLNLITPLLTGVAASVNTITAGGALTISAPAGVTPAVVGGEALGAELNLNGATITQGGTIALPSGRLTMTASGDITLTSDSRIDVAGKPVTFFDTTKYSWGGDVVLTSNNGNVTQQAGALIDISAANNNAGTLTVEALAAGAGNVSLAGLIKGDSSGEYVEGGGSALPGAVPAPYTYMPYASGGIDIRAQTIADFTGLNQRLTASGVTGSRSFAIKQGNLVIGNEVKANAVTISVDGGSLIVNGTIDASGAQVGIIRLSARDNLELTASANLDAHGTVLQVDGYGNPIEASNRGSVELTTTLGTLSLDGGSTINVSSADGVARGMIELNAPRVGSATSGDIAISARDPISITGAASIAVNGFWTYTDAPSAAGPDATGNTPQIITQDYLDTIDIRDTVPFMNAALANTDLQGRLAGLEHYSSAFHLRPGIQITSATPNGDLTVPGDLDFSGYRYASLNPNNQQTGVYGSGEPGTVIIRAGGNLNIYGSITDGFGKPVATPDDNGWVLIPATTANFGYFNPLLGGQAGEPFGMDVLVPISVTLAPGTLFNTDHLNFAIPIGPTSISGNTLIPTLVTLASDFTVPAAGWVASAMIQTSDGRSFVKGQTIPGGTSLPAGTTLAAGSVMPGTISIAAMIWPAGVSLAVFSNGVTADQVTIPAGSVLPSGTLFNGFIAADGSVEFGIPTRPIGSSGTQGSIWAVAPMLAPGSLSWSIRLVAGADLGSADTRGLQSTYALTTAGNGGNLILGDQHYTTQVFFFDGSTCNPGMEACISPLDPNWAFLIDFSATPVFSVLRTGTGNLDLLAGGSFLQHSTYGIYTAGTQAATVDPIYDPVRATTYDGTVLTSVYSDPSMPQLDYADTLVLNQQGQAIQQTYFPDHGGNLLLSVQGDINPSQSAGAGLSFSWNSNFLPSIVPASSDTSAWLWRQGGDVVGQPASWSINFGSYVAGAAPVLVGFAGIGTLGGGNATIAAGGNIGSGPIGSSGYNSLISVLNAAVAGTGRVAPDGSGMTLTGGGNLSVTAAGGLVGGSLTDIRGNIDVEASTVGRISTGYGQIAGDPRAPDLLTQTSASSSGGPIIQIGDGHVSIDTRGDLVVTSMPDPGRTPVQITNPYDYTGPDGTQASAMSGGTSWFTLWTAGTSVDLFSAGGNITPTTLLTRNDAPPSLSVVAADGSIYLPISQDLNHPNILELAPSPLGQLQMLAGTSIYANGFNVEMSGADPSGIPTPFRPAFQDPSAGLGNQAVLGSIPTYNLYWFEADTPTTALHAGDNNPILFYAAGGDIVNLHTGDELGGNRAAKEVRIMAGRDIVGVSGLIVQNGANDISTISAGRDIFYANFDIAGQGLLQVIAGRNVYQADQGSLHSIGPLLEADKNAARDTGTAITVMAGVGAAGPNYAGFATLYLDPANLADPKLPLDQQPGKVVKNYDDELSTWLQKTHAQDFKDWAAQQPAQPGSGPAAYAYFKTLSLDQQGIFLRQIYFAELNAGAIEHNTVGGARFDSYFRGREAIAALFPSQSAVGTPITYDGSVTMFGASGIHTDAGGAIQVFTPGGQTLVGVEGLVPPSTAGLITQGAGDIDVYSQGSLLLGLSRVMTSFGGNILAWSAEGDINAGRGSKTTPVFTPPQRTTNLYGSVTMSPVAPTAGAGIATLNPIPEVPRGNVTLVAPFGTIDPGEAGIRVSGNVTLAALQILNTANIQVQGTTSGIPVVQAPSISTALTATNAGAATQHAGLPTQSGGNAQPSVIIVEVLGYGGGSEGDLQRQEQINEDRRKKSEHQSYDPNSAFRAVGNGKLTDEQRSNLTEREKENLDKLVSLSAR